MAKRRKISKRAIKTLLNNIKDYENLDSESFVFIDIRIYLEKFDNYYGTNLVKKVWSKTIKNRVEYKSTYAHPLIFKHKDGTQEEIWEMGSPKVSKIVRDIRKRTSRLLFYKKLFSI